MKFDRSSLLNGSLTPWDHPAAQVLAPLRSALHLDAVAVGCLHSTHPQADELWVAHGWTPAEWLAWFSQGHQHDRLWRAAQRHGAMSADPTQGPQASSLLKGGQHALALALADDVTQTRWWWILLVRQSGAFSDLERRQADLLLRHWMTQLVHPEEKGVAQWLVGADLRLLTADYRTYSCLLQHTDYPSELLTTLPALLQQRYPHLSDHVTHDLALPVGGHPYWIRLLRSRALELPAPAAGEPGMHGEHWFLQLLRLEADDLPPVGLVKDERIAQALAYIHQHYADNPSLTALARIVHISPFHFHRLFTRQVGVSPKVYLQKKQLQMARWLLRQGGKPIGVIAQETGFSSHGHFTSTFHRVVGASPSEFRDKAE